MLLAFLIVVAASPQDGGEPETVDAEGVAASVVDAGVSVGTQTRPTAPSPQVPKASPIAFSAHAAAELAGASFPSGFGENGPDAMVSLHPVLGFSVGEDFSLKLGPTFRFRLIDSAPANRPTDVGAILRGADWDEVSDFGQLVSALRIGTDASRFHAALGPVRKKSLGLGHLVWRYSNQTNADYHPASAQAVLWGGPLRTELFASDVLGARLFAGELGWDLGATFSSAASVKDRFVLALEVAHDFNAAALPFRPDVQAPSRSLRSASMLHLDLSAVVLRTESLRWLVMAGAGMRAKAGADTGFLVGTALDATVNGLGVSSRVELRKQAGGFRHGFFGPMYELQRFVDTGYSGPSIGVASLPDGYSVFAELRLAVGTALSFEGAAEYFMWNRLDLDGGLSLALLDDWLFLTAHTTMLGLAQTPRYALNSGLRWRLIPGFYVLAEAGTVFFPQVDGSLVRGVTVSAGVGVDFER